ncbi:glutamate-cysteine ligase family protein [Halostagnicola bangensis]
MQKSIEVEYWVTDRDGVLTRPGELTDVSAYTEAEFVDCLFELKTPPCESIDELRSTVIEQLDAVLERAAELDKRLVPLGTPINCESMDMKADERGRIQKQVVGSDFKFAKYCAGTHVHFEQRNVTDQLNALIALDPALALCNSSPYYQGDQIASSARAYLYRKGCYQQFPKHGQLWQYVDTVAEWNRRLETSLEEFKESAKERGISEAKVDAHFSTDDAVWTPVRLREEMPTVEWRSPDATLPSQLLRLVGEMNTIMEEIHHTNVRIGEGTGEWTAEEIVLPEFERLDEYAKAAMIDGLESTEVSRYLERMGFRVEEYDPLTADFETEGHVPLERARELRLRNAERLIRDVELLKSAEHE